MKKVNLRRRSLPAKHTAALKTFDEYFGSVPESERSNLAQLRAAIRSVVPQGARETISYGIPAFKN